MKDAAYIKLREQFLVSIMSSRKRKLDLLPSFDEMYNELESEKLVVKKFMKYHKEIVGLSLDQGGSSLVTKILDRG